MTTNGISIYVEKTNKKYHTLKDWGLVIGNNDYIGEPKMQENLIEIQGRDGMLDLSEVTTGRPVYVSREIDVLLGGLRKKDNWDSVVSDLRNKIEGRFCHLIFDNDKGFYYRGRIFIRDYDRKRELGTLRLLVPNAEPYKYSVLSSVDEWEWDIFNFNTGIAKKIEEIDLDGEKTIVIPKGHMPVSPEFIVTNIREASVAKGERIFTLLEGRNRFPSLMVNGDEEVSLKFSGKAYISIEYRGGSL